MKRSTEHQSLVDQLVQRGGIDGGVINDPEVFDVETPLSEVKFLQWQVFVGPSGFGGSEEDGLEVRPDPAGLVDLDPGLDQGANFGGLAGGWPQSRDDFQIAFAPHDDTPLQFHNFPFPLSGTGMRYKLLNVNTN